MRQTLPGLLLLACLFSLSAFAAENFPRSPNPSLTPGALCRQQNQFRYPERIPYCERKVSPEVKQEIMRAYDARLGYSVTKMDRDAFKIDHYIPLCMGGSNEPGNLWPQHESVYQHTDPLEGLACEKMAEGRLRQADAIRIIRQAKADPAQSARLIDSVSRL